MAIHYKLLPDGGFVAGDDVSGLTSYAYPSSVYADSARRRPLTVAKQMLAGEALTPYTRNVEAVREYDARNWATLKAANPL